MLIAFLASSLMRDGGVFFWCLLDLILKVLARLMRLRVEGVIGGESANGSPVLESTRRGSQYLW